MYVFNTLGAFSFNKRSDWLQEYWAWKAYKYSKLLLFLKEQFSTNLRIHLKP
jgi:hypothetical protein